MSMRETYPAIWQRMRPLGPRLIRHHRLWWASRDRFQRPGLYLWFGDTNHRVLPIRQVRRERG
jgi:hypothetical protein